MRFTVRAGVALLCALAIGGILAGQALAAAGQVSIAEDDPNLMENPVGTLQQCACSARRRYAWPSAGS
jgi:hypothetical protein